LRNEKSHERAKEEAAVEKAKTFLKGKTSQIDQGTEEKDKKKKSKTRKLASS